RRWLRRGTARRGGRTLPRTPSPGTGRPPGGRVGAHRPEPSRPLLSVECEGAEAPRARARGLGQAYGSGGALDPVAACARWRRPAVSALPEFRPEADSVTIRARSR